MTMIRNETISHEFILTSSWNKHINALVIKSNYGDIDMNDSVMRQWLVIYVTSTSIFNLHPITI